MIAAERRVAQAFGSALATKATPEMIALLHNVATSPLVPAFGPDVDLAGWSTGIRFFKLHGFGMMGGSAWGGPGSPPARRFVDPRLLHGAPIVPSVIGVASGADDRAQPSMPLDEIERRFAVATEAVRADLAHDADEPVVSGWSCGALFTTSSVHALATVADADQVETIGVDYGAHLADGAFRRSRRTTYYDLAAGGRGTDGAGVEIALIDGEPATVPALRAVAALQDFTTEGPGHPTRHATFIAGLLVGQDTNYRGIAPEARVVPYKIVASLDPYNAPIARIIDALQQAGRSTAQVINCSFSIDDPAHAGELDQALALFLARGKVIIRSAGNDGAAQFSLPCSAPGLIIVGACDLPATAMAPYSNGGNATGTKGFVVAPGGVAGRPLTSLSIDAGYLDNDSGTSFAAALVSGLAARLISGGTAATPTDVFNALVSSPVGPLPAVLAV